MRICVVLSRLRGRWMRAAIVASSVTAQVQLSLFTDFENFKVFKPDARRADSVNTMLDQLVAWSTALKSLRQK